ncbi:uncharacterized protein V6R79_000236, partial [Siganus canaliculatus]
TNSFVSCGKRWLFVTVAWHPSSVSHAASYPCAGCMCLCDTSFSTCAAAAQVCQRASLIKGLLQFLDTSPSV